MSQKKQSKDYSEILSHIPHPRSRVLVIGSHCGELVESLASQCGELTCVDTDGAALAAVRAHATLIHGDFRSLELPEFDYIVAVNSLNQYGEDHAFPRIEALLSDRGRIHLIGQTSDSGFFGRKGKQPVNPAFPPRFKFREVRAFARKNFHQSINCQARLGGYCIQWRRSGESRGYQSGTTRSTLWDWIKAIGTIFNALP
ncbi:class I SAM-dependent methyltransferase [Corynebacterium sp. H128]|uniref:class I SAM-dependent methyltransferase n=1 Tax=unclassified Corynebacterium TaxID=2624378 RepID=UPI003095D1B9